MPFLCVWLMAKFQVCQISDFLPERGFKAWKSSLKRESKVVYHKILSEPKGPITHRPRKLWSSNTEQKRYNTVGALIWCTFFVWIRKTEQKRYNTMGCANPVHFFRMQLKWTKSSDTLCAQIWCTFWWRKGEILWVHQSDAHFPDAVELNKEGEIPCVHKSDAHFWNAVELKIMHWVH